MAQKNSTDHTAGHGDGGRATLRFARTSAFTDSLRRYTIEVDGTATGKIGSGEQIDIAVDPGPRTVRLKIDWCSSNTIRVEARGGETVDLDCGTALAGWRIILAVVYVLFYRDEYIWLRRAGER
jgi:hypothetical protein